MRMIWIEWMMLGRFRLKLCARVRLVSGELGECAVQVIANRLVFLLLVEQLVWKILLLETISAEHSPGNMTRIDEENVIYLSFAIFALKKKL